MSEVYLRRTLAGFEPADEPSRERWRKFKLGEIYRGNVVKPRDYTQHKQAFALLNLTYENQERYTSFEHFRKAVAIQAGHVDEVILLSGEIAFLPKSINYDALDDIEFVAVFAAMMTVCAQILGGLGLVELQGEVSRYADDKYGRAA